MANESPLTPLEDSLDTKLGLTMSIFKDALIAGNTKNIGPLWKAWHYLQVYSVWGLRLPNTESALAGHLKVKPPISYLFFPLMVKSYGEIHDASKNFMTHVFPQVVGVGNDIRAFGQDAKTGEDGVFTAIIKMLNDKKVSKDDVRDLITDLQDKARKNADNAGQVSGLLTEYAGQLSAAQVSLNETEAAIMADDSISDEKIALLDGGEDDEGSLAYFKKLIKEDKAEYEKDVILASTSPVYSVVPLIGLIATAVMAGVYGSKATAALGRIDKETAALKTAEESRKLAYEARSVQGVAQDGVAQASSYTRFAIKQVDVVQKAWNGIVESLDLLLQKLDKMTTTVGDQEKVRARSQVKTYARRAGENWLALWPAIEQLTDDPYIVVEDGETSIPELIDKINAAIEDKTSQN